MGVGFLALYVFEDLSVPIAYLLGFGNRRRFFRAAKVLTKKPHVCKKCGQEIQAGSEAYAVTIVNGFWDYGRKFTVYYHKDCYEGEVERVKREMLEVLDAVLLQYAEEKLDIFGRKRR
ncbi:hypothetical protein [Thermococcus barophilus]|uniref:PARP-type domain-containing protein n=1 Tax=Thermococcus barophilus TaxID=55802 RepID=A0A0S1XEN7_THEBA|nr:hypothetical protein [Thermococcus barophilus]ALM76237.1 hypothetical protein TBCH5v1_2342 [Thermococcus barophilus]